ncbi:hypothetical protein INT45_005966 [Circinella minor]|uniref:Uncharacterized protein n=1 Tax=Circinella minor TaxID=1195481 RepID=A0A8H7SBG2_9FUNG|nr:hypothetical protein INT45_005966 [Circinella minor]
MLRARSENTRGVIQHHKKNGENDGIVATSPSGKQELQQPSTNNDPSTPLLKDKDVNQQRSIQPFSSTKTNEKDRSISTSTTQKGSKFKVYSDKENIGTTTSTITSPTPKKSAITPVKRSGSNLETLSPVTKRVETETASTSTKRIEQVYRNNEEEELSFVPEVDLDFSAFNDRLDFNIYDKSIINEQEEKEQVDSSKIHIDPIDECDNFIEKEESFINIEKPTTTITTKEEEIEMLNLDEVVYPSEVEYGPPKETELEYEPEVAIDVSEFSEFLPDINAYECKDIIDNESIPVLFDNEEEGLLIIDNWINDDDINTEEFELLDDELKQDPFFTLATDIEETEQDSELHSLLFADHLFDVDEYLGQQQQQVIC